MNEPTPPDLTGLIDLFLQAFEVICNYGFTLNKYILDSLAQLVAENVEILDQTYYFLETLRSQGKVRTRLHL